MLLDTLADQAAELDEIAEDALPEYRARVSEILSDVGERDPEVFEIYSEDVYVELQEFAAVPRADKDGEWLERFSALVTAAQMQAFAELVLARLLETAEQHGDKANGLAQSASLEELRAAAKVGISKDAVGLAASKRAEARKLAAKA